MIRRSLTGRATLLALAIGATAALLAGCERPAMDSAQAGFRGTAMAQVTNPRVVAPVVAGQPLPEVIPPVPSPEGAPLAKDTYKNVQVLGNVPAGEFTRTMLAITAWVAPKQGCNYCHAAGEDLSSDKLYTKVVARKMLAMTRHLNADWSAHVKATGVTCYTCHRGEPVPAKVWFTETAGKQSAGVSAAMPEQKAVAYSTGLTSLAVDPLTDYLLGSKDIRANGTTALPVKGAASNTASIRDTEGTFALMVHMSQSLGVNCTHCHNTRSVASWAESPPTRTQAWHGIRMARDINNTTMVPLTSTFPAERLGPGGDVAKVSCATCHQGLPKPLGGAPMLKDYPALGGAMQAAAQAAAMPAAATTTVAGLIGKVLFDIDKTDLGTSAREAMDSVLAALKAKPELKVALSGFADKSGNAERNLELAKQRAVAVRDALKAAGVADDRVVLRKPEFVIGGADADARRVDITSVE